MNKLIDLLIKIIVLIFTYGLIALFALLFMWSWNNIMPYLFKLPVLNWIQAFSLLVIHEMLFSTVYEQIKNKVKTDVT